MNPAVNRKPAIKRVAHPAEDIPDRPTPPPAQTATPAAHGIPASAAGPERLTEQHNVRIRPSTKTRLTRAVDRLRYQTGDRSISIASLTDQAIMEYLHTHELLDEDDN